MVKRENVAHQRGTEMEPNNWLVLSAGWSSFRAIFNDQLLYCGQPTRKDHAEPEKL